jgi:hypothetical protein
MRTFATGCKEAPLPEQVGEHVAPNCSAVSEQVAAFETAGAGQSKSQTNDPDIVPREHEIFVGTGEYPLKHVGEHVCPWDKVPLLHVCEFVTGCRVQLSA